MKRIILSTFAVISLLIGLFLIGFFGYSFFSYYPFSFAKTETIVEAKESEIRLSFFPKYYVYVVDEADVMKHRVSKNDMLTTQIGEPISGYENNERFVTGKQIFVDVMYFLVFTFTGILLVMLSVMIFFRNASWMYRFQQKKRSVRRRLSNKTLESMKYILLIGAILFIFGGCILHLFQIYFTEHEQRDAEIVEMERKPGYGRYSFPTYQVTLHYELDEKWIQSKIKVSKEVFDSAKEGKTITIFHKKNNPYYVFLPSEVNTNVKDIFVK